MIKTFTNEEIKREGGGYIRDGVVDVEQVFLRLAPWANIDSSWTLSCFAHI